MDQDLDLIVKAVESLRRKKEAAAISSTEQAETADGERRYKVSPSRFDEIQSIVDKIDRYDDMKEFVDESIDNTIKFWLHPETMQEMAKKLWPSFTGEMKEQIKKTAPVFYGNMEQEIQVHNKTANMVKLLHDDKRVTWSKEKFSVPDNIVLGDAYSLIHQSYNRFFPLKLLVTSLRLMIEEKNNTRWVTYDEFSRESFDISLEFSNKLKKIKEKGKNPKRNIRISTGLPISHTAIYDDDMQVLAKNLAEKYGKDEKSKQRFFDCFIGPKETTLLRLIVAAGKEEMTVLSGALNETGLVHIRNNNGKLEITLSEHGFEFSNYDNPIIDGIEIIDNDSGVIKFNENADGVVEKKIFSEEETKFIMNKIIPKFTLEKEIIDDIVDKIKNDGEVDTKVLDKVIKNSVKEWKKKNNKIADEEKIDIKNKENYRIATMGRLAEIGVVDWKIVGGKSVYSINK